MIFGDGFPSPLLPVGPDDQTDFAFACIAAAHDFGPASAQPKPAGEQPRRPALYQMESERAEQDDNTNRQQQIE